MEAIKGSTKKEQVHLFVQTRTSTLSTASISIVLQSEGLLYLNSVITVCLVVVWAFIAICYLMAVYWREIIWPGYHEDSS